MEKEKKLKLEKSTVQNLNTILDREEQELLKGGTNVVPMGTTAVPIYCRP
ncbi:MAG: hypothetical protein KAW12_06085 [Candidatus Aminicenantes bacterium]|nr:hypothetical protein [Candidatus Aminicenantes bacterium]